MENRGLTNSRSLQILIECMEEEISTRKSVLRKEGLEEAGAANWLPDKLLWLYLGLRHSPEKNSIGLVFCWRLHLAAAIVALMLWIGGALHEPGSVKIFIAAFILSTTLLLNLLLCARLEEWRRTELVRKAENVKNKLAKCLDGNDSGGLSGVSLFVPSSECIHLQWVYRDGQLANLPVILLAEGDRVLIRPGREAPCQCKEVLPNGNLGKEFSGGDLVHGGYSEATGGVSAPLQPLLCQLTETPLRRFLRDCFRSPARPSGVLSNEASRGTHVFLEVYVIPTLFLLSAAAGILRALILPDFAGAMAEVLLIVPASLTLPILGLFTPLMYFVASCWCQSRLIAYSLEEAPFAIPTRPSLSPEDTGKEVRTVARKKSQQRQRDFCGRLKEFFALLLGSPEHLPNSANPLETLGTVTAVSVVDKKGILSWPNPSAEKIFFVKQAGSEGGQVDLGLRRDSVFSALTTEVLDLTHDPAHAFSVSFDDPGWQRSLANLKPLGVNILLNSCGLDEDYVRFLDHIHVVSDSVPRTIPVVNRRCCCHLAGTIGFEKDALNAEFRVKQIVAGYKRQPGQAALPGLTRHRTPLPNIFSALVEEERSKHLHLMSQGTADLLLELCSHCWSGEGVVDLPRSLRRKIADFYHRNSMTCYCLAFAYSPVTGAANFPESSRYIDWPLDPQLVDGAKPKSPSFLADDTPRLAGALSFSEETVASVGERTSASEEKYAAHLKGQVFLGMMTLQYQAKPDVVQLVEHLDKACVRFIHFSKENELRSRVFAEKMGLESGWNCHISLAEEGSVAAVSDNTRSLNCAEKPRAAAAQSARKRSNSVPAAFKISTFDRRVPHQPKMKKVELETMDAPLAFVDEFVDTEDEGQVKEGAEESPLLSESDGGSRTPNQEEYCIPNTAQLPKGIQSVRPHLETVDNVPLLVSLFTDCSHDSIREMVRIMQDYGEVVLVIGSSLNAYNSEIFTQANGSIALEPLQPATCVHEDSGTSRHCSAAQVSGWIYSLPCSFHHKNLDLLPLLELSRHSLGLIRSALLFYAHASLALWLAQFVPMLLFLPPAMSVAQLALFLFLLLPLISLSLLAAPLHGAEVLQETTSRNENWLPKKRVFLSFGLGFLTKFLPGILMAVAAFTGFLILRCRDDDSADCSWHVDFNRTDRDGGDWGGYSDSKALVVAQNLLSLSVLLYLSIASSTFVYVSYNFWSLCPLRNWTWILAVLGSLLAQCVYSYLDVRLGGGAVGDVPWLFWLVLLAWTVPVAVAAELWKRREISISRREQRRRRLSFGTKLGLNSPF